MNWDRITNVVRLRIRVTAGLGIVIGFGYRNSKIIQTPKCTIINMPSDQTFDSKNTSKINVLLSCVFVFLQGLLFVYMTAKSPDTCRFASEKIFYHHGKQTSETFASIDDPPSVDLTVVVPAYNEEDRCEYCSTRMTIIVGDYKYRYTKISIFA